MRNGVLSGCYFPFNHFSLGTCMPGNTSLRDVWEQSRSFLLLCGIIVFAFAYFSVRYSIAYNVAISDCLHSRIFLIDSWDKRVIEGELVAFEMNVPTEFYGTGDTWVKKVAATGGKTVRVNEHSVSTNTLNIPLSAAYVLQKLGREPGDLRPEWELADDELFMVGETLTSLDSRFWGPIKRADVKGRAYAIL